MTAREVVLLGSTGSIGTQAIDVVRAQPRPVPRRRARRRAAAGRPARRAGARARRRGRRGRPATAAQDLQLAFYAEAQARGYSAGRVRACRRSWPGPTPPPSWPPGRCDVVLNGMTGSVGLAPTLAALRGRAHPGAGQQGVAGRRRAAGHRRAAPGPDRAGRLRALRARPVPARRAGRRGAPAGAHRERRAVPRPHRDELADVTPEQALAHPTWDMGPVVTINSATLVNKGLEVIEAHLLFGVAVRPDRRRRPPAVDRPLDGRVRRRLDAGAGQPAGHAAADRARPWAGPTGCRGAAVRPATGRTAPRPGSSSRSTTTAFPAVELCRAAGERAAPRRRCSTPPTRSASQAFLDGRLPFPGIVETVAAVVDEHPLRERPTLAEVLESEQWARQRAGAGRERAGRMTGQAA